MKKLLIGLLLLSIGQGASAEEGGEVALPEPTRDGEMSVERALAERRSVRDFRPDEIPLAAVAQILWAGQGITDPRGFRTAPSAGALYPIEIYLVAGRVTGLAAGVYRYDPRRHHLLLHTKGDARAAVVEASLRQAWMAEAPAILVLGAVYERTARKYGRRSPRYVHMEVGHVAQNVYLQAASLGLGTTMVGAFRDEALAGAVSLPGPVKPIGLLPIGKPL